MDLRTGIIETANALGMNPTDLATIISYETAGTFDPTKAGPTTQWGQHRGLIQWGEPQAQQYGVDWQDPLGSQLGANGAIVRYYQDRGWQPGMGLMDAYSIVNAGAPGRYGASDANNGGAPGTVADKVNSQMAGHARKAADLLGGTFTPTPTPGAPQPTRTAADMAPTPEETLKLFGLDTGVKKSGLEQLAQTSQPRQQASAPQVRTGPGYQRQHDSLARALEAHKMTQQARRG